MKILTKKVFVVIEGSIRSDFRFPTSLSLVQIAAFIGEPVMGAGGVMPAPKMYWEKVIACFQSKVDVVPRPIWF